MINPSREQVAVALFNLVSNVTGINYASRRPQLWEQAKAYPALYMGNPNETYVYGHDIATPALVTLEFDFFLYIKVGLDPNIIPDTQMNTLLDAIEAALQAQPNRTQTLGGIVHSAWIEGAIHRAPGYLDGQGAAFFTVKVLVPQ